MRGNDFKTRTDYVLDLDENSSFPLCFEEGKVWIYSRIIYAANLPNLLESEHK